MLKVRDLVEPGAFLHYTETLHGLLNLKEKQALANSKKIRQAKRDHEMSFLALRGSHAKVMIGKDA